MSLSECMDAGCSLQYCSGYRPLCEWQQSAMLRTMSMTCQNNQLPRCFTACAMWLQGSLLQAPAALLRQWISYGLLALGPNGEPTWHRLAPHTLLCHPVTQQWRSTPSWHDQLPEGAAGSDVGAAPLPAFVVDQQLTTAAIVRAVVDTYATAPHPHDRIIGFHMQAPLPKRKITPVQPCAISVRCPPCASCWSCNGRTCHVHTADEHAVAAHFSVLCSWQTAEPSASLTVCCIHMQIATPHQVFTFVLRGWSDDAVGPSTLRWPQALAFLRPLLSCPQLAKVGIKTASVERVHGDRPNDAAIQILARRMQLTQDRCILCCGLFITLQCQALPQAWSL